MNLKLTWLASLLLILSLPTTAQDFSNKGKEFWLAYSFHVGMVNGGGAPVMTLYITSDINTPYKVEIFGGATIQSGNITAGQVVTVTIPTVYFINDEAKFTNKAIRVTADQPVVVYSYITRSQASAATLCLPTTVLGREYYSSNFTQISNEDNANSFFTIVAVEDNTTVEITPSATTKKGWAAGSTYTVTLNKGEIYQVLGKAITTNNPFKGEDLSGSHIKSIANNTGGCKRIAVFSGSGKIQITATSCAQNSSDNLYQQLYPVVSWGLKYLTVPSYNRTTNIFRITKSDPSTNVYLNGSLIPASSFVNNRYYQFFNNKPNSISADKPISVAQYFTTQGCDANASPYDPDMILLNPVEQNIDKITLVSSNLFAAATAAMPHQHHIHVIMKNGGTGISSFRLDGNSVPASSWAPHPADPSYSYLYLSNVSQGFHRIESDSGFNALAYGYANAETYGYSAGANVKDLYQFASIKNQYATVDFPAACTQSPFFFRMTFPYQPTEIKWVFGSALNNLGISDYTVSSPVADSTFTRNGRQLYQYTVPTSYTLTTAGTFPIRVVANNPTAEGCTGEQEISYDLQVFDRPTADFKIDLSNKGCLPELTNFTDISNTGGRSVIKYIWNVDDARTSSDKNPQFSFDKAGNFNVAFSVITDIGCVAQTVSKPITISAVPKTSFDLSTLSCENNAVGFKDLTTSNGATVTQWLWNFGDGSTATVPSPSHTFTKAGTYTVSLALTTDKACGDTYTKTITVSPLPQPSFEMPGICLQDANATFTNTTSISDGTTGSLKYQWTFGGASTVNAQAVNSTATYSAAGTYSVTLEATSINGCKQSVSQNFTVNSSLPQAKYTFVNGDAICSNKTVSIQNGSGVGIGNILKLEIFWKDGVDPNDKTTIANPPAGAVFSKTYSEFGSPAAQTYTITVRAYSGISCFNDYSQTVTLKATPQVKFDPVTAVCADAAPFQITSATISNSLSGTGIFSGTGASSTGLFDPKSSGAGSHLVRYTFTGTNGCINYKEQSIVIYPVPKVDAGPDRFMLEGGNTVLLGTATGNGLLYQWSPPVNLSDVNSAQPTATPSDDITYTLKVTTADKCTASDQVFVKVLKAPTIPNVFTPNGDGINDKWIIQYLESYPGAVIRVYNRYGQPVFESKAPTKEWDGTFNGKPLPAGTYYYIVDPKNGRKPMSGYVDIVR